MKILITDDSSFMRSILKNIILQNIWPGAEVIEAKNGNECIDMFHSHHPDLITLDLVMPEKEGIEVLAEIGDQAKIVVVSAVGQEDMIDDAKELGAKFFVNKPFQAPQIIEVLKQVSGQ